MAESETYINQLPTIIELNPLDTLIIETSDGTKQILFQDFILGADNVDFYNIISQNETDVLSLSTQVVELSATTTTLTTNVSAISASNEARNKYGFCYVEVDNTGSIILTAGSTEINNVELTDAGSRLKIYTTGQNIDFADASVLVTFNYSVSTSSSSTSYLQYSPVIDSRSSDSFKVGIDTVLFSLSSIQMPTGVTLTEQNQPVSTDIEVTYGTAGGVSVVTNVAPNEVNIDYIQNVAINTATISFNLTTPLGTTRPIVGNSAVAPFGINIQYRYQ